MAKIWKNDIPTNLTDGVNFGEANYVFVSGSDVYVAVQKRLGSPSYNSIPKV